MGKYRKAIAIVVWERDQPEEKYVVNLGFHVQAENVDGSWTGVKMTQKELDKHRMRMVIVKKVNKVEDLAMFLRTYKKETKPKGFKFTLVNSHGKGKKDKKVDTIKDKVVQVNYLSLYFKGIYTVSTTVESADYTSRLGIFLHDGIKDGYKYYKQLHTVEGSEGRYSYRYDEGVWGNRKSMLDERSSLRNLSESDDLPCMDWDFDNKPKMAYSRDLPKMARWMTGMDEWYG